MMKYYQLSLWKHFVYIQTYSSVIFWYVTTIDIDSSMERKKLWSCALIWLDPPLSLKYCFHLLRNTFMQFPSTHNKPIPSMMWTSIRIYFKDFMVRYIVSFCWWYSVIKQLFSCMCYYLLLYKKVNSIKKYLIRHF